MGTLVPAQCCLCRSLETGLGPPWSILRREKRIQLCFNRTHSWRIEPRARCKRVPLEAVVITQREVGTWKQVWAVEGGGTQAGDWPEDQVWVMRERAADR